ncbi:MAG: DNA translocase FtsK 4TM domain-containing protein [Candidatus Paceibacterota bacterium]
MPRKKSKKRNKKNSSPTRIRKIKDGWSQSIHPEIRKTVWVIFFLAASIIFVLAAAGQAGPVGESFYNFFEKLFGVGYWLLPVASFILAFSFVSPEKERNLSLTITSALIFIISGLGLIDIYSSESGGTIGSIIGGLESPLGTSASTVIMLAALVVSFLIVLNKPFDFSFPNIKEVFTVPTKGEDDEDENVEIKMPEGSDEKQDDEEDKKEEEETIKKKEDFTEKNKNKDKKENFEASTLSHSGNYKLPPLSLLASKIEKPTIGDLRANANIIKRTLDSFGIPVEMGEVQVGPTVTRYTLKPAEGVKLSKITALHSDLSLALAAHPLRIEAPIPGKSLVGIEVPNKQAAIVRLGSLLVYPEFQKSDHLSFILGRDVSGDPVIANIAKMPHMLVAGATGSGKSITIHAIIQSLLFKNSPEHLRMVMIDPKRVELSVYNDIPHLISPVITENKKAIGALNWAVNEMDERYERLLSAGVRDIKGYNKKNSDNPLPYILIVIDELADLMATYSREVEGAIIRLAQMSRATGIHLVVSTQRPSVEVITGLIKANITTRISLQVASQIDSRTILDMSGAEKLLGNGDLLFISSESSKPKRVQGAFITEKEIKSVVKYIKENNETPEEEYLEIEEKEDSKPKIDFEKYNNNEDGDELYEDAIEVVKEAGKGSASLIQRRLRVGYARAARLLDMMEEAGIVGPPEGSKPRELLIESEE